MTKEELKEHCKRQVECCEMWARNNGGEPHGKVYEEHKLVLDLINTLDQSGEDCVSRADLLKLYEDRFIELQKAHHTDKQLGINWCINTLKEMPHVIPTHGTCKDCKKYRNSLEHCTQWVMPTNDDFYCADYEKAR